MAFGSASSLLKAPSMLEQLLEEINFQRTKEMRQLLKDDSGFVMLQGTTYWTDLFVRHFLFQNEHCIDCDDLLFFVRKRHIKGSSRYLPKFETEVDVFRKDSRKLPIGDPDIDWEETVYLNLIIHQFDYTLTLAICTRTSPKELQVLKRHSQGSTRPLCTTAQPDAPCSAPCRPPWPRCCCSCCGSSGGSSASTYQRRLPPPPLPSLAPAPAPAPPPPLPPSPSPSTRPCGRRMTGGPKAGEEQFSEQGAVTCVEKGSIAVLTTARKDNLSQALQTAT